MNINTSDFKDYEIKTVIASGAGKSLSVHFSPVRDEHCYFIVCGNEEYSAITFVKAVRIFNSL